MRSGVAGASMCTTCAWLAVALTASRSAKKVDSASISGGSPVALLRKGVGLGEVVLDFGRHVKARDLQAHAVEPDLLGI